MDSRLSCEGVPLLQCRVGFEDMSRRDEMEEPEDSIGAREVGKAKI